MKKYVFDLDGTLANMMHRVPLIRLMVGSPLKYGGVQGRVVSITTQHHREEQVVTLVDSEDMANTLNLPLANALEVFKKDWDTFFAKVKDDSPILPLCNLFLLLQDQEDIFLTICTGRNAVCTEDTMEWLELWGLKPDRVMFRREDDRRPDFKVKFDMYTALLSQKLKPDLVFDDRQQVVDMWRKEGIRVCQVAPGNF